MECLMPDTDIQIELEPIDVLAADADMDAEIEAATEMPMQLEDMELPPLDAADAIVDPVRVRDILLEKLRKAALKSREDQTKAFLDLLTRVQQLCVNVSEKREQVAMMTRDWKMSRAEAHRLLRLQHLSEETKAFYAKSFVTPEMIVALEKATVTIREEAHLLISAGRVLHTTDLAQMRKRRDAANPAAHRAMQNRKMRAQMVKASASQLGIFKSRMGRMVRLLAKAYEMDCDRHERRAEFLRSAAMASAGLLLREFDALFTADLPGFRDWYDLAPEDIAGHLARVRFGLERMSQGDFLLPEFPCNDWGSINLTLVQALAWLTDIDVTHLPTEWPGDAGRENALEEEWTGYHSPDEQRHLTSLEICSGAGGAAIGLHAAGFESVGLVERDRFAARTLMANQRLGPIFFESVLDKDFKPYVGQVDLFAGGVPCQPHSVLGKQAGENDKRDLFGKAIDIIREVRPRAVMLENVLGFGQRQAHAYRAKIFADLLEAGYDAELFAISACEYGLAQARPRLILVAMRDGLMSRFKMPPVLTREPVTLGEALGDLMAENGWPGAAAWAERANERGPTIVGGSEKSGNQGFASKFQLEDWAARHIDARRIALEAPGPDAPENDPPGLTLRMGARLQGFPTSWGFQGAVREQRRQIANAFPPIMAAAVGLAIREALTGERVNYDAELSQYRIECVGRMERSSVRAHERAKELNLPLGDGEAMEVLEAVSDMVAKDHGGNKLEQLIDPSGIKLVRQYCKASRRKRAEMDIRELPEAVRDILAPLQKNALKNLAKASDWAIRRFIDGKYHGIANVPGAARRVGPQRVNPTTPAEWPPVSTFVPTPERR